MAALLATVSAGGSVAHAQSLTGNRVAFDEGAVVDDPQRVFGDDAWDFAPLAIVGALGLSGTAAVSATYSDNVARARNNSTSSRFDSRSDWIIRPTVGIGAERALGRQRIYAKGSLGRTIYARNSQLNSNRVGLGGGVDLSLGRACGGGVQGGYSRRDTQLGLFEEVVASTQERTNFGASLACSTITGISGSVAYGRGKARNSTESATQDRSFADVDFQSVTGSVGYRVGQRGQVGVSASWGRNEFPNQLITGEVNTNETKSYSLFGSYRVGNRIRANAGIGKSEVTSNLPGFEGFSGTTWNIGVGYSGNRLGANFGVGQGVNGGGGGRANFSVQKFLSLSATYRLNDNLSASAGYSRTQADFRGNTLVPETVFVRTNTDNRLFIGADYRLNRMLSFSADLNHQRRSSDPGDFAYNVTNATVGVRARF